MTYCMWGRRLLCTYPPKCCLSSLLCAVIILHVESSPRRCQHEKRSPPPFLWRPGLGPGPATTVRVWAGRQSLGPVGPEFHSLQSFFWGTGPTPRISRLNKDWVTSIWHATEFCNPIWYCKDVLVPASVARLLYECTIICCEIGDGRMILHLYGASTGSIMYQVQVYLVPKSIGAPGGATRRRLIAPGCLLYVRSVRASRGGRPETTSRPLAW
jgi:hypothetical protein